MNMGPDTPRAGVAKVMREGRAGQKSDVPGVAREGEGSWQNNLTGALYGCG